MVLAQLVSQRRTNARKQAYRGVAFVERNESMSEIIEDRER